MSNGLVFADLFWKIKPQPVTMLCWLKPNSNELRAYPIFVLKSLRKAI